MSPSHQRETTHNAAVVIIARVPCCLTAAGQCYVMLGTIKFVDKRVKDNSMHRLGHCDVIASRSKVWCAAECTVKLNSKPNLSHLQQLIWDETQTNTWIEQLDTHASNPAGQFMPLIWHNPCDCSYLNTKGVTMLTGFPWTRWPWRRFSESYNIQISTKISRICERRVIMGIMTRLLGCCSCSALGSRANDYVKTLTTLGFWLHHSPRSLGCWMNNILATRSLSPKQFIFLGYKHVHYPKK